MLAIIARRFACLTLARCMGPTCFLTMTSKQAASMSTVGFQLRLSSASLSPRRCHSQLLYGMAIYCESVPRRSKSTSTLGRAIGAASVHKVRMRFPCLPRLPNLTLRCQGQQRVIAGLRLTTRRTLRNITTMGKQTLKRNVESSWPSSGLRTCHRAALRHNPQGHPPLRPKKPRTLIAPLKDERGNRPSLSMPVSKGAGRMWRLRTLCRSRQRCRRIPRPTPTLTERASQH